MSDLWRESNTVVLTDDFMEHTKARAVIGSYYDRERKAWVVENPVPKAAAVICKLFPHLQDEHPELVFLRDSLIQDARPFDNATALNLSVAAPHVQSVLHSEPCARCAALHDGPDPGCHVCGGDPAHGNFFPFQRIDLGYMAAVLRKHGAGEIAWERGLGKTLAACALIEDLSADRIMVVAPNTAKEPVWEAEVAKFCGHSHDIQVMPHTPEKRARMIDHLTQTHERTVFVCHYEALDLVAQTRANGKGWQRIGEWDLVVADESHRLANNKTKKHKALRKVPTHMKLSETGSAIMNHPEEVFGRLNWLFPKVYRSKWRDWNDRFLEYVEPGYGRVLIGPNPDTVDTLRREWGVFTVYRRKSDELDLPKAKHEALYVDLSPQQRAAYDELRNTLVTTLDSGELVAALEPVVLLTRLRQLASGMELVSGRIADSTKLDCAVSRIRDCPDDGFVCFSWFKSAAYALARRLEDEGEAVQVVTGDTTQKQRTERIKAFQSGSGGRCFIGTISTLGESVNLHRANHGLFIDRSWNPAENEQAADRYYRIGQKRPVVTEDIIARDTVDESNVMPVLRDKNTMRKMILGGKV